MSKAVSTESTARNREFTLHIGDDNTWSHDQILVALLADIRNELRNMNATLSSTLNCHNTRTIPHTLQRIDKRLAKKVPLK